MTATDLQEVANAVVRRAQGQGSVRPGEIRAELARLGVPEKQWKEIVGLAGDLLHYRRGRYYYEARTSSPLQEEDRQRKAVHQTVRELIRHYKKSNAQIERREHRLVGAVLRRGRPVDDRPGIAVMAGDPAPTASEVVVDPVSRELSRTRMTSPPMLLGRKLLKKVATR